MFSEKTKAAQAEFWIAADQVVSPAQNGFYAKLEETLESFAFAAKVRALCAPAFKQLFGMYPLIAPSASHRLRNLLAISSPPRRD